MRFGIFCAVPAEAAPFLELIRQPVCRTDAGREVVTGTLCGQSVALITGGVGKVFAGAAAQLLIDRYQAGALIAAGTAGAMDPTLEIGDVVLADAVAYHDVAPGLLRQFCAKLPETDFLPDPALLALARRALEGGGIPYRLGRFVTGDKFVDQQGRAAIWETFHPLCTDMESAALAQVCALYGVPFLGLRGISDTPGKSGLKTFEENCAYAAQKSASALTLFFEQCAQGIDNRR